MPFDGLEQRMWAKISPEPNSGCWLWTGADDGSGRGYGKLRGPHSRQAHRVVYEFYCGAIPEGLTLDHTCRTPGCVNPNHLEPVSWLVNLQRGDYRRGLALGGKVSGERRRAKTHCKQGHSLADAFIGRKQRHCRQCVYAKNRRAAKRKRDLSLQLIGGDFAV